MQRICKKLEDEHSQMKNKRLEENFGKLEFCYDSQKGFEPVTKAHKDTNKEILEEKQSITNAIEQLTVSNGSANTLDLLKKKWIF